MSDYSDWTETEIEHAEFVVLMVGPDPVHARVVRTAEGNRYFRLDPPAPKYREGEMRWLTENNDGERSLVRRISGGWSGDHGPNPVPDWPDTRRAEFTLSEPVVVVPAPTDEERVQFLNLWARTTNEMPAHTWLRSVAADLRMQQEARDE